MSQYALEFRFQPQDSTDLILGTVVLLKDAVEINAYIATSGLPGHQDESDWTQRGRGLIVPNKPYQVATTPIDLRHTKGVEGKFYVITPYLVDSGAGKRGDFGIHFDANVPGSAGCIVLTTRRGWLAFQRDIQGIAAQGISQISLLIEYF